MTTTAHPVDPFILRHVDLIFGDPTTGDEFRAHVSRVAFTPSNSTVVWQGLSQTDPSASFTGQSGSTWVANLAGAQDWTSATSLSDYLFEHEGEEVPVRFTPRNGGTSWDTVLTLAPTAIGGDINSVPVFDVSLGCKSKPVKVAGA